MKRSEIKEMLKSEAKTIRATKIEMKEAMRNGRYPFHQGKLALQKWEWRHKHIAYCILKGRTIEQIEKVDSWKAGKSSEKLIQKYTDQFSVGGSESGI